MIDAAVKALAQMFAPPFRWVLLKSAGLAALGATASTRVSWTYTRKPVPSSMPHMPPILRELQTAVPPSWHEALERIHAPAPNG